MMKGPRSNNGWILPLCRIIRELGALIVWDLEEFCLIFPCGKDVYPIEDSGLKYIRADDLFWIRKRLLKSHLAGRPVATETARSAGATCKSIGPNVESNHCDDPERGILAGDSKWEEETVYESTGS